MAEGLLHSESDVKADVTISVGIVPSLFQGRRRIQRPDQGRPTELSTPLPRMSTLRAQTLLWTQWRHGPHVLLRKVLRSGTHGCTGETHLDLQGV